MAKNKYVSKGERVNCKRSITNAVRNSRTNIERLDDIMNAYEALKNPWVNNANPNTKETNKKRIRVRSNDLFGDPKSVFILSTKGGDN